MTTTTNPQPIFTKQAAVERVLSGSVMDCYDDAFIEKEAQFPDFVKNSPRLTKDELVCLPDHAFAAVILDRRGSVHRKWALIDPGHVWMAAHYWSGCKGVVPDAVRNVAAHYILEAAGLHGAILGHELPHRSDLERAVASLEATPSTNVINTSAMQTSYADLTRSNEPAFEHSLYKGAEAEEDGEGEEMMEAARKARKRAIYALMGGSEKEASDCRYPIHTRSLLKKAVAFFAKHEQSIPFDDRFEYAGNVCKQAHALGVDVPQQLAKYAHCDFHADAAALVRSRHEYSGSPTWPDGGSEAVEKIAALVEAQSVSALQAMKLLEAFDKKAGLQPYWRKRLPDPARCFAVGEFKLASGDVVGHVDGEAVTVDIVKQAVAKQSDLMSKVYGREVVDKLACDETAGAAFRAMPERHQRQLLRLGRV